MVVPVSGTESAEVRQVNEETGMLNIVGKDRILISMEMPLRFCEIGKGWLLDKLPKRKRKNRKRTRESSLQVTTHVSFSLVW